MHTINYTDGATQLKQWKVCMWKKGLGEEENHLDNEVTKNLKNSDKQDQRDRENMTDGDVQ